MLSVFDAIHGWTMLGFFQPTTRNTSTFLTGESSSSSFQHSFFQENAVLHFTPEMITVQPTINLKDAFQPSTIHPIASRIFLFADLAFPWAQLKEQLSYGCHRAACGWWMRQPHFSPHVCWGEKMEEKKYGCLSFGGGIKMIKF